MSFKAKIFFSIFIFIFALLPLSVFGQAGELLNLEITPETPSPGQLVRARVSSYSTDLSRAQITWYLGGSVASGGVGETEFSFTAPASGRSTTLTVTAKKQTGGTLTERAVIRPAQVILIWQSNTYTPPSYLGRALHSSQGTVRVVAIPELVSGGVAISSAKLVYTWKRNGKPLIDDSGYGKNEISFTGAKLFGEDLVELEVSTLDGTLRAKNQILIRTVSPEVIFYPILSLLGPDYSNPIGSNYSLIGDEASFRAEAYYVSSEEKVGGELSTRWSVAGKPVATADPFTLTVRNEGASDNVRVSFDVSNPRRSLQSAGSGFDILLETISGLFQ